MDELELKLIKEWNFNLNKDPFDLSKNRSKKYWWKCTVNSSHEWQAMIKNRLMGTGCPICSNKKIVAGINDLVTTHPDLIMEWDFSKNTINPTEVSCGSNKTVWWRCSKGHSFKSFVYSKTLSSGCPYCSGQKVLAGYNDLYTTNPDLAKDWNFQKNKILPSDILQFSNKKVWWVCINNHEWEATVSKRSALGRGCPICVNQKILAGYNDLASQNPEILLEWDYALNSILPTEIPPYTNKKVW